jgi:MucR family transcriptional regulator, transcriptional regulator of exopolysaccharide biosynthesis
MSNIERKIIMTSDVINLTAQIVISHASMSELTPEALVAEIKEVYNVLSSLDSGAVIPEAMTPEKAEEAEAVKKSPIPLKDIVKEKYVVCLECGKKMRTLKAHIRKALGLVPKEYFKRFGLDPKKYPLVCREYSKQRSAMAKNRGFGVKGTHHKASS